MADLRAQIRADRFRAHEVLFAHRHEYPFAPFHRDLVADFWCDERFYIDLGFRACGKTTLVEEAIAIAACEGAFRNCVIVGAKESLAAELLASVKIELENNDLLLALYGEQRGDTWTSTKITLQDRRCIQAIGRDQAVRGTKHMDWRPDLVVINDFEVDEEILNPDGRRKSLRWVLRELLPVCDPARQKVRIYDSLRHPETVPMQLHKHAGWPARFIPVSYLDDAGVEQPSWPGHPAMTTKWIERERNSYTAMGERDIWEREYMCNAASQADRTFQAEHIKVEPVPRTWQAVYAMIDPARTVRRSSATTGWAVWSWVRNRLIVWEAGAKMLMPDEIIELAFRIARDYAPVEIGVEEDGLNEWLMQPSRARMLKEGIIPLRAVKAPRGKIDFIRGLQPFFAAGEVVLSGDMPELREQLLGFPTGRIDAPNALAYALTLRPGRLIYEEWNPNAHIEAIEPVWRHAVYLGVNASRTGIAAVLAQCVDGRTLILADFIAEGEPGETLENVVREASLVSGGARFTLIAGRQHWEQYGNVGLVQAARTLGIECRPAGEPARGREFIRRELGRSSVSGPSFAVSPAARWVLNGFAGGYSRPLRDGALADPENNRYRLLFEGLEAFCGLMAFGIEEEEDISANFAYDAQGRRYRSALPARMQRTYQ